MNLRRLVDWQLENKEVCQGMKLQRTDVHDCNYSIKGDKLIESSTGTRIKGDIVINNFVIAVEALSFKF
jgi:hypothetical protein